MLALATAVFAALFLGVFGIEKLFIAPAHRLDRQAISLRQRIAKLEGETARKGAYLHKLDALARRTYAAKPRAASEAMRAQIVQWLNQAGLDKQRIQLSPQSGRHVPKVMQALGWSISVRGKLSQVIHFLYLLEHQPRVHRLEDLVLMPVAHSDEVALRVKCSTLVLAASKDLHLPKPRPAGSLAKVMLTDKALQLYQPAIARNVFLPALVRKASSPPVPASAPVAPGQHALIVVGLPHWGGRSELIVRQMPGGQTKVYHVGDRFGAGTIVAVDYRPMPRPSHPDLISQSRVILRLGGHYWAIELGNTLAEKHRIAPGRLPAAVARDGRDAAGGHARQQDQERHPS